MGSWAHRRSTVTFKDLTPRYEPILIAAKRCAYISETDLELPTRRLTAVHEFTRRLPGQIRGRLGWGTDQWLFGFDKAVEDIDLLFPSSATCLFSYQAARHCERTGKPLVVQEVETIPLRDLNRWIYPYRAKALATARLITCVTERTRACLVLEGVPTRKLRVIPFGIDTELFHPRAREVGMRKQLGYEEGQIVILFAGRTTWEKGLIDLVDGFKLLVNDLVPSYDLHLAIVGGGPDLRAALERVKYLGVSDRVRVLPFIPFDQMPALYAAADMVVAPSNPARHTLDQWPLVVAESMSTGVPVVTTYCGGIPEQAGDGAIIVQPSDPLSLLDAMKRLVCNPELRRELGEAGRRRVLEKYDWRVVGQQYAEVLDEVQSL